MVDIGEQRAIDIIIAVHDNLAPVPKRLTFDNVLMEIVGTVELRLVILSVIGDGYGFCIFVVLDTPHVILSGLEIDRIILHDTAEQEDVIVIDFLHLATLRIPSKTVFAQQIHAMADILVFPAGIIPGIRGVGIPVPIKKVRTDDAVAIVKDKRTPGRAQPVGNISAVGSEILFPDDTSLGVLGLYASMVMQSFVIDGRPLQVIESVTVLVAGIVPYFEELLIAEGVQRPHGIGLIQVVVTHPVSEAVQIIAAGGSVFIEEHVFLFLSGGIEEDLHPVCAVVAQFQGSAFAIGEHGPLVTGPVPRALGRCLEISHDVQCIAVDVTGLKFADMGICHRLGRTEPVILGIVHHGPESVGLDIAGFVQADERNPSVVVQQFIVRTHHLHLIERGTGAESVLG